MEIIEYEEPMSWDDKGMDWNNPDPRKADYIMAIRRALMERYAVLHKDMPLEVLKISPWKTVTLSQVEAVIKAISELSIYYFNDSWTEYKEDYSDFPKKWSYRDIIQKEGCKVYEYPRYGELCESGGEWLKQIKNAIDLLSIIPCQGARGIKSVRSAGIHDPPFEESITSALEYALNDDKGLSKTEFRNVPYAIFSWSGNTHWKCPVEDSNYEDDKQDGYCGYVDAVSYKFTRITNWLKDSTFNFLAYAFVGKPKGAVAYSQELATSDFDPGESGFVEGMQKSIFEVDNPSETEIDFGNSDSIPKNTTVPESDFDDKGNAILRRSAKRGYEGKVWFFCDYGREGGFKFRSTEA